MGQNYRWTDRRIIQKLDATYHSDLGVNNFLHQNDRRAELSYNVQIEHGDTIYSGHIHGRGLKGPMHDLWRF